MVAKVCLTHSCFWVQYVNQNYHESSLAVSLHIQWIDQKPAQMYFSMYNNSYSGEIAFGLVGSLAQLVEHLEKTKK